MSITWHRQIPTQTRLPSLRPTHFTDTNPLAADVPCGNCTLCCKIFVVPLAQEEDFEQYDWAWITAPDGTRHGRALNRKPNGECVYLTEKGCSIHPRRPHVCRGFDCRELFKKSDRRGRDEAVKSGKLPKSIFDKGREMLKEHPL